MFETIVVGYDASAQAQDALALATAIASPSSRIVLCCAHPFQPASAVVVGGEHHVPNAEEAIRRLEDGAERIAQRDEVRTVAVSATSAAAGLHAIAEEEAADLLVVGSSHRGTVGRIVLGSTTSQVLTAPPCAVAVAPGGYRTDARATLRRVVVGFDGGGESRHAAQVAAGVARDHGAELTLLTIVEPVADELGWSGGYLWPELRDDALAVAREDQAAAVGELTAVELRTRVVEGSTAAELIRASLHSDLLVLGSRGYGPVRRVLLGAVAAHVAREAACPVLVVPRAGDDGRVAPHAEKAASLEG